MIGTLTATKIVVPTIGLRTALIFTGFAGTFGFLIQGLIITYPEMMLATGITAFLGGGVRALVMTASFSQAGPDQKPEVAATYRLNESLGKFIGKLIIASTYMVSFMEEGA